MWPCERPWELSGKVFTVLISHIYSGLRTIYTVHCSAALYTAIMWSTLQYRVMQCSTILYCTVQCYRMLCSAVSLSKDIPRISAGYSWGIRVIEIRIMYGQLARCILLHCSRIYVERHYNSNVNTIEECPQKVIN